GGTVNKALSVISFQFDSPANHRLGGHPLLVRARQGEIKRTAPPELAVNPDTAGMILDDAFGNPQAQPTALAPGFLDLPEPLENMPQALCRHAFAGIGNTEEHILFPRLQRNGNAATCRRKFQG